MNVIEVGSAIYFAGSGSDHSETFRVPESRQFFVTLESVTINCTGTTTKVTITLEQSSDLRTWTTIPLAAAAHEMTVSPEFLRTVSTVITGSMPYVVQPYIRLKYDGSSGVGTQRFLFSARITLTEI